MKINYLIIDDEPIAHTLIESFAKELDYLTLAGNCHSAMSALPIMKSQNIDLIFLDINMPKLNGFEFLSTLTKSPQIIIISAHKEHALESYEYTIADYLLKPFNFERFCKSIQKVVTNMAPTNVQEQSVNTSLAPRLARYNANSDVVEQFIFIKNEKKNHKVAWSDINYIKADGNYTKVYLKDQHIFSQMKISDFEKLLPVEHFSRIHRTYLIAHHAVTLIKANEVALGDITLPVGRVYKDNVKKMLNKN